MMIAYKGFHKGLICMGYQFVMGKNVTEKANSRQNGFHCAENPLDCLTDYPDIDCSEYYIVEAGGDLDEDGTDTKISCTERTIIKRLTKKEFFLHELVYMTDHTKRKWSSKVQRERGEAAQGYAVVGGSSPRAKGKVGDIIALAKEEAATGEILQIAVAEVDGKDILSGRWYDVNLQEGEDFHEEEGIVQFKAS